MERPVVLRPTSSKVIAITVWALVALSIVLGAIDDVLSIVPVLGVHGLAVLLVWAVFWRPAVVVGQERLTIRNILVTREIPWTAVEDIDTKWAFNVTAGGRRYTAWASPAPGALQPLTLDKKGLKHLPDASYVDGVVQLSNDPHSQSGIAALHARRRLEKLGADADGTTGAGTTDELDRLDHRVSARWHWATIAGIVGLGTIAALQTLL